MHTWARSDSEGMNESAGGCQRVMKRGWGGCTMNRVNSHLMGFSTEYIHNFSGLGGVCHSDLRGGSLSPKALGGITPMRCLCGKIIQSI